MKNKKEKVKKRKIKRKYYKITRKERENIVNITKSFNLKVVISYRKNINRGEFDFHSNTIYIYPKQIKERDDLYSTLFHEISHYLLKDKYKIIHYNYKLKKGCLSKYISICKKLYLYEFYIDKKAEKLFNKYRKKLNLNKYVYTFDNMREYKMGYKSDTNYLINYIKNDYKSTYKH